MVDDYARLAPAMDDQDGEVGDRVEGDFHGEGSSRQATLGSEEVRVLGSLLEKEMTTPEYYPLTLKALTSACNQKSNREPVVHYDTSTVAKTMEKLRYKGLGMSVHESGSRGAKNKHAFDRVHPSLSRAHLALMTVLFLRGQQTLGELRQRTERMHAFADLESVQSALDELILYEPEPLVGLIPSGEGRRVETYVHLLGGDAGDAADAPAEGEIADADTSRGGSGGEASLRKEVDRLRTEVAELREELAELRKAVGGG